MCDLWMFPSLGFCPEKVQEEASNQLRAKDKYLVFNGGVGPCRKCRGGGGPKCRLICRGRRNPSRPYQQSIAAIRTLDLRKVVKKVRQEFDWTSKEAVSAERKYRSFLRKCLKQDDIEVRDEATDRMWHGHILFTEKYHRDCNRIFGGYVHHQPSS